MKEYLSSILTTLLEELFELFFQSLALSIFLAIVFAFKAFWLFKWSIILFLVYKALTSIRNMADIFSEPTELQDCFDDSVIKLILILYIFLIVVNIIWNLSASYLAPFNNGEVESVMGNWSYFWPIILRLWLYELSLLALVDFFLIATPFLVLPNSIVIIIAVIALTVILAGMQASNLSSVLGTSPGFGEIVRQFASRYLTFGLIHPVA